MSSLVCHFGAVEKQLSGADVLRGPVRLLTGHPVQTLVVVAAV